MRVTFIAEVAIVSHPVSNRASVDKLFAHAETTSTAEPKSRFHSVECSRALESNEHSILTDQGAVVPVFQFGDAVRAADQNTVIDKARKTRGDCEAEGRWGVFLFLLVHVLVLLLIPSLHPPFPPRLLPSFDFSLSPPPITISIISHHRHDHRLRTELEPTPASVISTPVSCHPIESHEMPPPAACRARETASHGVQRW